jgi:MFS family permease
VRGLRVDTTPLRTSREFRLLLTARTVSLSGNMVTYVAVPFQAFAISHSSLVVGLLSLAEFVPILLIAFVGGALADAVDRRTMVRITELCLCVVSAGLLINAALPHPRLWALFVAAGLAAGLDALQRPSLDAVIPRIVPRDQLSAAVALESLTGSLAQIAGPPIAGVLIATIGLPATFGADIATFAFSLLALSAMRAVPPPPGAERASLSSIRSGLRYAVRRQDLLGTYLVDMNAMLFGMPTALFPQIATRFGGPAVLGLLYTAPSIGGLVAAATSGWSQRVRRHGRAIAIAAALWGVAIIGFGFAPWLWLALIMLALAGAFDMVNGIFRQTVWNQTIPDPLRGRLAGVEMISYTSGPTLGNVEAGLVAAFAGVQVSIVSGGALCVAGTVVLGAALPKFWNYAADPAFPQRRQ